MITAFRTGSRERLHEQPWSLVRLSEYFTVTNKTQDDKRKTQDVRVYFRRD